MIGEKIRKVRTLKGYSQEYVADSLKLSQPAYSDIEKDKTKVTLETLQQIAKVFEIELIDLINFDEKQIFNNTFNENSKGFFNVEKVITENFEHERNLYFEQIKNLKEEIIFLRSNFDRK